jgi:single-stranded-DNA-specific exonuclease
MPDVQAVDDLVDKLGVSRILATCLVNRGLCDIDTVRDHLEPRLAQLLLPGKMAGLSAAAERAVEAIRQKERVGVFGDYDVDGVASAALVVSFLRELSVETETMIADRFKGGYGLGPDVVERLVESGCGLIIVVDCGTSDHEAMERAAKLGVDVIIIDHHRVEGPHPRALAFINPQRADCDFPDKTMSAVGLAFYFVAAVRAKLVELGRIGRDGVDPRSLLDLVALGTVADVALLKGNNRIFVSYGLRQMSVGRRPGVDALFRSSKIRANKIRANHISFQLAPRLNAAGRVANAYDAFDLLVSGGSEHCGMLARKLEQLTKERRRIEEQVSDEARRQVEQMKLQDQPVMVLAGDGWHPGVIGIVAAKLVEEFSKPSYVIGFNGDVGVGSARASGRINLHQSLVVAAHALVRYGGHREAAGFMVERARLEDLRSALVDFATTESTALPDSEVVCDAGLNPSQLKMSLLEDLDRLGPFGNGNPEPVFEIAGLNVLDSRVVGANHLKLELKTPTGYVSAFGPRMGRFSGNLPPMIRVAASLSEDEWRGKGTLDLRLVCPPVPDA